MEVGDKCFFSILPNDASEALLLQAWQHLDLQHRFGIIPRVCSSWFHLSAPTFTSLELVLRDEGSTQQFAAWLRRHGSTLQHLSVRNTLTERNYSLLLEVLGSMNSCKSLSSLHLLFWNGPTTLSDRLLSQLSSLSVRNHTGGRFNFGQLCGMRQLQALGLSGNLSSVEIGKAEVHQLVSALPNLTSLDLTHTYIPLEHLASCPNLPPLQELKLSIATCWFGDQIDDLAALPMLPCTSLYVELLREDTLEDFKTWSAGQHGKNCLGRLTSMHCCIGGGLGFTSAQPTSHGVLSCLADSAGLLRHLDLTGYGAYEEVEDLALLTGLTQLTSLSFTYAGPADADVVTPLAELSKLQHLTVAGLSEGQAEAVRAAAAAGQLPCLKDVVVPPSPL
jgi:hypothetical protein